MKHSSFQLFASVIILLIFVLRLDAQTMLVIDEDEFLMYEKVADGVKTLVYWVDGEQFTYEFTDGKCGGGSGDGRYLILSTEEADILQIVHFRSGKVIYQQIWDERIIPCGIHGAGNTLFVMDIVGYNLFFRFENLTLTELPNYPSSNQEQPIYPVLPGFYPESTSNFILQNPTNPNIYFYEKCNVSDTNSRGRCGIYTEMVIYDSATEQNIEIIEGALGDYMRGYDTFVDRSDGHRISAQLASWSPDGRYLAYFDSFSFSDKGNLGIYDLQSDTYFEDVERLYNPNVNQPFKRLWLDNTTFVLWHNSLFWESTEYHSNEVKFVFAHADSQTYTVADQPFDVLGTFYPPDGQGGGILFVGKAIDGNGPQWEYDPRRGDLVYISATTGESTIIDTDVTEIITWRSICDFTPTDTASLISTMQSEPYSVICLAENGQYDLTAPLPDVAGDITIIGNGATLTMTGENPIFNVVYNDQWSRNGMLTLKNLTIVSENAEQGGAIANAGELNLEDVRFENGEQGE